MCILKKFIPNKGICRVTFTLPESVATNSEKVALVGDFNDWDTNKHLMKKIKDGRFICIVNLPMWKKYQFRYLLDDTRWENDWDKDGLAETPFTETFNSLLIL
jgi:1,4-alpha-glucan branching enzyme